jgi:chemotaxis protein methyltransferase CheR
MAFTFFFRDIHTLEQVVKKFIPIVEGRRNIKIWDAGCAMGPEPYTFLILLSENLSYWTFKKVQMDASDLDESDTFGKIITEGIYPYDELKRMPEDVFKKYFYKYDENGKYKIDDNIKSRITFHKHDLTTLKPINSGYNLIICKNVLLHLHPDMRIEVYKMFHSVLDTDGLLVTEQTQSLPDEVKNLFESLASDAQLFKKIEK